MCLLKRPARSTWQAAASLGSTSFPVAPQLRSCANNPGNSITAGRPIAYFSFAAANPDGGEEHMRSYGKDGASRTQTGLLPVANDPTRIHMMGVANGGNANFSDFILQYSQSL